MKSILTLAFLAISFWGLAQEESSFVDQRDGQTYRIITYDLPLIEGLSVKRTWMAKNLNYDMDGSSCYAQEPAYCEVYGRLYNFEAAKEACPAGWRLPSTQDWNLLASQFGGMEKASVALRTSGASGMELQLGGLGDPGQSFKQIGLSGNYWIATKSTAASSGSIILTESPDVFTGVTSKYHSNSVRCIKDY